MKRVLILFGLLFAFGLVSAIPNPAPIYCENMGHIYNETDCIFSENESCELWAFFNGSCGQEFVQELECREAGENLEPGYECCEGLVSIDAWQVNDEGICEPLVGSWSICADCGNGICDEEEDSCNCAEDCGNQTFCAQDTYTCPNGIILSRDPGLGCEFPSCPDSLVCEDLCGDGTCQDEICEGADCPCQESGENCPEDCEGGGIPLKWWFIGLTILVLLVIIAIKIAKWVIVAAIIAAILLGGVWFFAF